MVNNLTIDQIVVLKSVLFSYLTNLEREIKSLDKSDPFYDKNLDSIKNHYNYIFRIYSKLGG